MRTKGQNVKEERKRAKRLGDQQADILVRELKLVQRADIPDEMHRARDLHIPGQPYDVLSRIRTPGYVDSFTVDFTLRCYNPVTEDGVLKKHPPSLAIHDPIKYAQTFNHWTELPKVLWGWSDVYLYSITDPGDEEIIAYRLIDLEVFRAGLNAQVAKGRRMCQYKPLRTLPNAGRDDSTLAVFRYDQFPPNLIIAQRGLEPDQPSLAI